MPFAFLSLVLVAAAEPAPRLAVLDFQANGARPELASASAGMVANELGRLGLFRVISNDSVRALVGIERQKQLLGCADAACGADLGALLGTDYAVTGKVSRINGGKATATSFTLELTLLDVAKGKREGSDIQTASTEAELLGLIPKSAIKVVGKILSGHMGSLIVESSEAAAAVKVDDLTIGTTPVSAPTALPAGPHFLSVEKEGFVTFQKEVRIQSDQAQLERTTLVPSPDFIGAYEKSASRMRLGAYLASGVAVAGVGAAVALQVVAAQTYGSATTPGTFQYARAKVNAGIESDPDTNYREQATRLKASIDQAENLSYIAAGVAGAAAVTGAYFWIAGDAPDRYTGFKKLGVTGAVTPGGVSLGVGGGF